MKIIHIIRFALYILSFVGVDHLFGIMQKLNALEWHSILAFVIISVTIIFQIITQE